LTVSVLPVPAGPKNKYKKLVSRSSWTFFTARSNYIAYQNLKWLAFREGRETGNVTKCQTPNAHVRNTGNLQSSTPDDEGREKGQNARQFTCLIHNLELSLFILSLGLQWQVISYQWKVLLIPVSICMWFFHRPVSSYFCTSLDYWYIVFTPLEFLTLCALYTSSVSYSTQMTHVIFPCSPTSHFSLLFTIVPVLNLLYLFWIAISQHFQWRQVSFGSWYQQ
jgi:hypothetical protein